MAKEALKKYVNPPKYFHRPDRAVYELDESLTRAWGNDQKHKLKKTRQRQTALQKSDSYLRMNDDSELTSHDLKRLSARKPLKPQPLKIAKRHYDFNQTLANRTGDWSTDKDGVNRGLKRANKTFLHHQKQMQDNQEARLSRRTKEEKPKKIFTPLKKTLLRRLETEMVKAQLINDLKFHTARFVNGKKIGKYPQPRKELMNKINRLKRKITKEDTRLASKFNQDFTPLKESIVVNGIFFPLNVDPNFDETSNKRIKQLRRILFLDEDQAEKSSDQAIAMDGLFALEGGRKLKHLAQLILGREKEKGGFMKKVSIFSADRNQAKTFRKLNNNLDFINIPLRITDVLKLVNLGVEQIPIVQVRNKQDEVIIQISYLKGDKILIELPGKYMKPADLELIIEQWFKTYDVKSN